MTEKAIGFVTVDTCYAVRVSPKPSARARRRPAAVPEPKRWREAVYAFPLPEGAAVDRLRLRVGGQVIEGQARGEAPTTYEQARTEGKRTALVEQHRPDLFTTSVANIPPGDETRGEIAYRERVAWRDGRFGLRFPMAITPRYPGGRIPAKAALAQVLLQHAWENTLEHGRAHRPWPWADHRPVARLKGEWLGIDQIVLHGDSGPVAAFAPGLNPRSFPPEQVEKVIRTHDAIA